MKLKTLDLNRETLRVLNTEEQDNVQGAAGRPIVRCSADTASRVTTRVIYCC
ncbi:MAG: hypothetical protein IPL96_05105 [Holophagaceae bacterium]|nr:hypothetical protein [Holophagaceae bacterium]